MHTGNVADLIRIASLAIALGVGLARSVSAATGAEFHYQVERVVIDGNHLGPLDGTPDWVDGFVSGSLGWTVPFGTAYQADGRLHLVSPGARFEGPEGTPPLDISVALAPEDVGNGYGSFEATAYWVPPGELPLGHHFHFSIVIGDRVFGLGLQNLPAGYGIEQHEAESDAEHAVYDDPSTVLWPLAPSDVTGEVGLRIAFDDATDLATTSFTVDGGATWSSPFAPVKLFTNGGRYGLFIVSADPQVVPATTSTSSTTSTTLPLVTEVPLPGRGLEVVRRRGVRRHRLSARLRDRTLPPSCEVDGELTIDTIEGRHLTKSLPAAGWRPRDPDDPRRGCEYDDRRVGVGRPRAMVELRPRKAIDIELRGRRADVIPLDTDPRPILYTLRHGDVRYCVTFGGRLLESSPRHLRVLRSESASCTLGVGAAEAPN